MKVVALVFLAVAVFSTNAAPRADVDIPGRITEIIQNILEKINEPLVDVHDERYSIDLVVEKIEFLADNVELKGVKNLDIQQLDYDDSTGRLDYELVFEEIDALVDLELNLSGLILTLTHHPIVDIILKNLKLAGSATVDTSAEPFQLTDFSVLITLDESEITVTDILNDDELTETLNDLLKTDFVNVFNSITAILEPAVSPVVQSVINIILRETNDSK